VRDRQTKRWVVLVSFVGLMGLIFVLLANLNRLEFLPGKALPNPFGEISTVHGETGPLSKLSWVETLLRILPYLFLGVFTVAAVASTIFYRKFRRTRIALIWTVAILLVLIFLFYPRKQSQQWEEPPLLPSAESVANEANPPVEVEIPPIQSPNWGLILVTLMVTLGIGLIATSFITRVYPSVKSRLKKEKTFLETFGERAGEAVEDIRAGKFLQDVVFRCYKDMSETLSRTCHVKNTPFLTPHEFAALLRDQGVDDKHVKRLTAIFEQVRYGGRSEKPFANEAITCLESIQRAYATDGGIG
jgi:hypothetical protein